MKKKRKILGMTAAIVVIVSLLIVNVPAEEKENFSGLEIDKPSKVIEKYGLQKTPPAPIDPKKLCEMPISSKLIKKGLSREEMKKFPKMPENRAVYKKDSVEIKGIREIIYMRLLYSPTKALWSLQHFTGMRREVEQSYIGGSITTEQEAGNILQRWMRISMISM